MAKPRVMTTDEVRDAFMRQVAGIVRYWQNESRASANDKVSGVMHSLLVLIDGGSGFMPAWKLISDPHPEDEQYNKDNGENWFPPSHEMEEHPGDISSDAQLHELLYRYLREEE